MAKVVTENIKVEAKDQKNQQVISKFSVVDSNKVLLNDENNPLLGITILENVHYEHYVKAPASKLDDFWYRRGKLSATPDSHKYELNLIEKAIAIIENFYTGQLSDEHLQQQIIVLMPITKGKNPLPALVVGPTRRVVIISPAE